MTKNLVISRTKMKTEQVLKVLKNFANFNEDPYDSEVERSGSKLDAFPDKASVTPGSLFFQ